MGKPALKKQKVEQAKIEDETASLSDIESSGLESGDEVDVADVSSSESEPEESESEQENSESESDDFPKRKKKKQTDDGSNEFASAFSAIVSSKLKAHSRSEPILARSKTTLKKLESEKLESKAKRALLAEKHQLHDRHRVKRLLPTDPESVREVLDKEKKLKKTAQRGVVKLFNAVLSSQIRTDQEISKEKVGQVRKQELVNEISKEKFLDLVQAAGE
ncbi:Ribosomal RNA-processing protein 15 [Spathaspora sp. JA1]|nr:Ribosomal RNA-processing protein 15 [Spathaspora sp. JA1]